MKCPACQGAGWGRLPFEARGYVHGMREDAEQDCSLCDGWGQVCPECEDEPLEEGFARCVGCEGEDEKARRVA